MKIERLTPEKLAEWHRGKMNAAKEAACYGEAQICTLGVDLRGYFPDGMWILTLSWEEVAAIAKEHGIKYDLSELKKAVDMAAERGANGKLL